MCFRYFRRFLEDRSGASMADYILLTALTSVIAAILLSYSASFTVSRAQIIQRLLVSPDNTGTLSFEDTQTE